MKIFAIRGRNLASLAGDFELIGIVAIFSGGPFLLSALLFAAGRRLHRIDSAGGPDTAPKA